jgi:hypothetical protein
MNTLMLGLFTLGLLAGGRGPKLAQPAMHRLEHAGIDAVERVGRRRQLAQHELHDLASFGTSDHEANHALDRCVDLRFGLF